MGCNVTKIFAQLITYYHNSSLSKDWKWAIAKTDISVSTDGTSTSDLSSNPNLFIVKKSPSIIGLKTAITGEELFFHTNGDDNDQYSLE